MADRLDYDDLPVLAYQNDDHPDWIVLELPPGSNPSDWTELCDRSKADDLYEGAREDAERWESDYDDKVRDYETLEEERDELQEAINNCECVCHQGEGDSCNTTDD
jgi:hypothetical protein